MICSGILRFAALASLLPPSTASVASESKASDGKDKKILILGGGVAGIIAARTFHEQGFDNFVIVEARDELGGRMRSTTFGSTGNEWTVELGANWVQGTQVGSGPKNPILTLAEKHDVKTTFSDFYGSMTTYDNTGYVDYLDVFNAAVDNYTTMVNLAGERVAKKQVDTTSRTGYSLSGSKPQNKYEMVSEYYQFDWEYAQTPEQTSWIASSWAENFTFDPDFGGFSEDNLFSIDPRGFKTLIQAEAKEFLKPAQVLYNHTVKEIDYSASGVKVTMKDGNALEADYVICTFSLGILQHDDVVFKPVLPDWKQEAIQSMTMATYTKIFLQFDSKYWFETQFGLYADSTRGRYPVWQGLDLKGFMPGSKILFVTTTGDYSQRIEALPDSEVQTEIMGVLRTMFPNVTVPDPVDFMFPRWHSDPLYRGSYSNWPSSFYSDHHKNLRATVEDRLWFAGEATSAKYYGFMHGAYYEGQDAADAVVRCMHEGGCAGRAHVKEVTAGRPYDV
ncbi:amine oxidase [Athelia psychrophila]|uniref:Amine oxidase n=1 Tax=Athelia psychrophila TaxID=1759441 RepID=A0A166T1V6_9AGAM|nr:amine oxidase [Fibularhizoctonia sp. CBS 109695]